MRSGRGRRVVPLSRTTAGETTRLWKRKKPNSPAGNFPPSRGSSRRPPAPMPLAWVQPTAPGGRGAREGGRTRVVLVRVRQRFHSLRSVRLGVFPLSHGGGWEGSRAQLTPCPSRSSQSYIRSVKKVSGDPSPRVGGGPSPLPFLQVKTNSKDPGKLQGMRLLEIGSACVCVCTGVSQDARRTLQ